MGIGVDVVRGAVAIYVVLGALCMQPAGVLGDPTAGAYNDHAGCSGVLKV